MADKPNQPSRREGVIVSLDVAIALVNIGKEASSMTPAPAVFGVATILLTTIRVCFTPLRERRTPDSDMVRTRWPTIRIVWSSGYSVPVSVMRLGGERMERGQTNSTSRCAMQSIGWSRESIGRRIFRDLPLTVLSVAGVSRKYNGRSKN